MSSTTAQPFRQLPNHNFFFEDSIKPICSKARTLATRLGAVTLVEHVPQEPVYRTNNGAELADRDLIVPRDSGSTPDQPNRKRTRLRVSPRDLFDSVTTCKGKGFYRIEVLCRHVLVAEYFVVKGFPKKHCWSVLTSESDFHSDNHFKSLAAAKDFCVERSI